MRKISDILALLIFVSGVLAAQTGTNMEKIYGLVEKSAAEIIPAGMPKESRLYIEYSSPENYSLLKNSLIGKAGVLAKVSPQKENSDFILTYTVEEAKVKYSDSFTKSFLGRSYVERETSLKGFAGLNKPGAPVVSARFAYSEKDTVEYGLLKDMGSSAYPYTNPEIPSESFFSSLWEPVIAIGVAVTTIYLLFKVRSK